MLDTERDLGHRIAEIVVGKRPGCVVFGNWCRRKLRFFSAVLSVLELMVAADGLRLTSA